jgi:hypothetical protein
MAILCFWPPDNCVPFEPSLVSYPYGKKDGNTVYWISSHRRPARNIPQTYKLDGGPTVSSLLQKGLRFR